MPWLAAAPPHSTTSEGLIRGYEAQLLRPPGAAFACKQAAGAHPRRACMHACTHTPREERGWAERTEGHLFRQAGRQAGRQATCKCLLSPARHEAATFWLLWSRCWTLRAQMAASTQQSSEPRPAQVAYTGGLHRWPLPMGGCATLLPLLPSEQIPSLSTRAHLLSHASVHASAETRVRQAGMPSSLLCAYHTRKRLRPQRCATLALERGRRGCAWPGMRTCTHLLAYSVRRLGSRAASRAKHTADKRLHRMLSASRAQPRSRTVSASRTVKRSRSEVWMYSLATLRRRTPTRSPDCRLSRVGSLLS